MSKEGGSVTIWLQAMCAGDQDAITRLWERYNSKLLDLARRRLRGLSHRAIDEQDIALEAFTKFYQAAKEGRLSESCNRGDLWRLLLKITLENAIDAHRRDKAEIRGGGQVVSLEPREPDRSCSDPIDEQPTPEMAAILVDEYSRLMEILEHEDRREIARLRLAGYQTKEIADHQGLSVRTIERRLSLIREIWKRSDYLDP